MRRQSGDFPAKLTEKQVQDALDSLIAVIKQTPDSGPASSLAQAVQALAIELTVAPPSIVIDLAEERLAAAKTEDEAIAWAGALVELTRFRQEQDYVRTLVEALKYPTSAGKPTDVIIDALHRRFPDAQALKGPLSEALPWFVEKLGADAVARPPRQPIRS